ncbi:MAG: hypothetical protein N2484_01010 [Clostridia bacterium]|nr:hypothetical protein [Clostridia bacterium]
MYDNQNMPYMNVAGMANQPNPMNVAGMTNQPYPTNVAGMTNQPYPTNVAGLANQPYPTMQMPEQLENMFPKTYYMVQPAVERRCDMMMGKHGDHQTPSREEVEANIDDIVNEVGPEVEGMLEQEMGGRQFFGYGGRRVFRDLVGILLLGSLLRRRPYGYYNPYPFYGYPGFYGGYPGYYGGFYGGYPY